MVLKQGIAACPNAGLAQLNSAYSGLGLAIGVVMPVVWGNLYAFFLNPPAGTPGTRTSTDWHTLDSIAFTLDPRSTLYMLSNHKSVSLHVHHA